MSQSQLDAGPSGPARRVAFRLVFAYLAVYLFPFPLGQIPGTTAIAKPITAAWNAIILWVSAHILHIGHEVSVAETGSGDRTADYVQLLCTAVIAIAAATVWSIVDRRRTQYRSLLDGLRVYTRYALGTILIGYGFAKVFKTQFPFPPAYTLMETYGESSPMRLLWTFMGYSTGYNVFTGGAEVLGGVLLYFRRTTTLGALVIVGVMGNVFMLNMCYDVPVKLFSAHLVLMAVFLMAPDLKRLTNVLVLNRPTLAAPARIPFERRWLERARIPIKVLFIGSVLISGALAEIDLHKEIDDSASKSPLTGGYEVESFVKAGAEIPATSAQAARWRVVNIFIRAEFAGMRVRLMSGDQIPFSIQDDPAKSALTLSGKSGEKTVWTYSLPDPDHLLLEGSYENEPISVRLRRLDTSKLLLVNRGFHWINEVPYNR